MKNTDKSKGRSVPVGVKCYDFFLLLGIFFNNGQILTRRNFTTPEAISWQLWVPHLLDHIQYCMEPVEIK